MEVSPVPPSTRIWAEIESQALQHNLTVIRRQIGPRPRIIAVVKANAYGHGIDHVVSSIRDHVDVFAVANVKEAEGVIAQGTALPVMILSPCLPDERPAAAAVGAIVTISSIAEAKAYAALASQDRQVSYMLKVDTGMGRVGVPLADAARVLREVTTLVGLSLHSVATHLPSADEDEDFTTGQLERFHQWIIEVREWLPGVRLQVLNSAGVLGFSDFGYDFVRTGLAMYGISPLPSQQHLFRPALTWKSRIIQVRDVPAGHGISYGRSFVTPSKMRIAAIAAGYADGFPRHVSGNQAMVLIGGKRCAILGRVTMDQILVDVTTLPEVAPGAEVVLLGKQGEASILASETAAWAGTIPWDIFTGIRGRTIRVQSGT